MIATIAHQALPLWGLESARVTLAAQRENSIFKVEAASSAYALRLHRSNYRTDDELRSELMWMEELSRSGLIVPAVIQSLNRNYFEVVDGIQVDVLTWVPGTALGARDEPLRLKDRQGTFRSFGEELARLHATSDAWTKPASFVRKSWDLEGFVGERPQWGRFWENPALTKEQSEIFLAMRRKARQILGPHRQLDFGLIHADLVPENVLIDGDRVIFIDFDDGGPGFRLYDFATALLRHKEEPDYEQLEQAFIKGYRSLREIDTELLPLFLVIKACAYVGWTMERMQEPANAARNQRFIDTALSLVRQFLSEQ